MNTILTLLDPERVREFYDAGFWRGDTIYDLACAHAARTPDAPAFRDRYRRMTYRNLVAVADELAADLHRRGVCHGQRVAVWLPGRVEVAIALLACSRNGYVLCPSLHRDHTVADVGNLLRRMRASALIYQEGYGVDSVSAHAAWVPDDIESLCHAYILPPLADEPAPAAPFAGMLDAAPGRVADPARVSEPDGVVYLAFTSGTTDAPKGVMHSDNTILANCRVFTADWGLDADSVLYTMSPLSHNLGLGALVNALLTGAELVVHDLPRQASLLDRLLETRASFLVGVPTHAVDLLSELRARKDPSLPYLKGFRISGAAASGDVVDRLLAYGVRPQSGYGMTEAGSHNYTLPDDDPALVTGSSGRAAPGYELKIWRRNDPEREAAPGEVGQIGGRGASLMVGYFNDQAATECCFNSSGWFMTGDLGWMDDNGYVRVTGRKKELIIRGGRNIYPGKLENLAMGHAAVRRAAAVPVADGRLGEKVCLAVMLYDNATVTADDLLRHLDASGLSRYDMPEYWLLLDDIPLTASGKILKRTLVERIASGALSPAPIRWRRPIEG
ncbi:MAG: class I adenylate-forming enzyme family protein [Alphaproteobacteria bacterium]